MKEVGMTVGTGAGVEAGVGVEIASMAVIGTVMWLVVGFGSEAEGPVVVASD
jgi:hypothetical protein